MAIYFKKDKIKEDPDLIKKIARELVLNEGKMRFFKKIGPHIALPYFYGKMLLKYEDTDLSFEEILLKEEMGIDLSSVEQSESESDQDLSPLLNLRSQHQEVKITGSYTLRPKQVPILAEAIDILKNTGTVFLQAATGFGKSLALAHIITELKYLAVLIFTQVKFVEQSAKTFKLRTNAIVWIADSKRKIPKDVQVIITTPQRFKHIPEELREKVGTFAIDEAPLICTPQGIDPILSLRPRYIIASSATIKRRNGMHVMLDMICGPTKVIKGLDGPVRVIRWHTGIKVPFFKGTKGADWLEHIKFVVGCEKRNKMIAEATKAIIMAGKEDDVPGKRPNKLSSLIRKISNRSVHKMAIITNRADVYLDEMAALIRDQGVTCDYLNAKKKNYQDSDVVMGVPQMLGIGFDAELSALGYNGSAIDTSMPLIPSATEELTIQELGRACRVFDEPGDHEALFFILIDNNAMSRKHARTAERALNELDDVKFFDYYGEEGDDD